MDNKGVSRWRFVVFVVCMAPVRALVLPAPVKIFPGLSDNLVCCMWLKYYEIKDF